MKKTLVLFFFRSVAKKSKEQKATRTLLQREEKKTIPTFFSLDGVRGNQKKFF